MIFLPDFELHQLSYQPLYTIEQCSMKDYIHIYIYIYIYIFSKYFFFLITKLEKWRTTLHLSLCYLCIILLFVFTYHTSGVHSKLTLDWVGGFGGGGGGGGRYPNPNSSVHIYRKVNLY